MGVERPSTGMTISADIIRLALVNSLQVNIASGGLQTQRAPRVSDAAGCQDAMAVVAAYCQWKFGVHFAGSGLRPHFRARRRIHVDTDVAVDAVRLYVLLEEMR